MVEKDSNLQKWREERDKLVEALEVQLKTLASNAIDKDKEIAELKQAVLLKDSGKVICLSCFCVIFLGGGFCGFFC